MPRKAPASLNKFRRAAQAEGYMKKGGGFRPLPKRGSAPYRAIKKRMEKM